MQQPTASNTVALPRFIVRGGPVLFGELNPYFNINTIFYPDHVNRCDAGLVRH
jgi:hypothetical protein